MGGRSQASPSGSMRATMKTAGIAPDAAATWPSARAFRCGAGSSYCSRALGLQAVAGDKELMIGPRARPIGRERCREPQKRCTARMEKELPERMCPSISRTPRSRRWRPISKGRTEREALCWTPSGKRAESDPIPKPRWCRMQAQGRAATGGLGAASGAARFGADCERRSSRDCETAGAAEFDAKGDTRGGRVVAAVARTGIFGSMIV